jgi:hypothetical protein
LMVRMTSATRHLRHERGRLCDFQPAGFRPKLHRFRHEVPPHGRNGHPVSRDS